MVAISRRRREPAGSRRRVTARPRGGARSPAAAPARHRVQVVGIKGRPELNGQDGTIGEFYGAKGRFPVSLEGGESVLIKMMNLVAIGDDM